MLDTSIDYAAREDTLLWDRELREIAYKLLGNEEFAVVDNEDYVEAESGSLLDRICPQVPEQIEEAFSLEAHDIGDARVGGWRVIAALTKEELIHRWGIFYDPITDEKGAILFVSPGDTVVNAVARAVAEEGGDLILRTVWSTDETRCVIIARSVLG